MKKRQNLAYSKKLKYDILRACGFEPKAARHFLTMNCPDELFGEVTSRTLSQKENEEREERRFT